MCHYILPEAEKMFGSEPVPSVEQSNTMATSMELYIMMPPCKYYERGSRVLDAGICLVLSYPLSMKRNISENGSSTNILMTTFCGLVLELTLR